MAETKDTANVKESESIHEQILASSLDIRDKKSGLIDLLTAGIETLATTLSVFLYYVSKHPDTQQKIFEELRSGITSEGILEATYTKACTHEAFRMTPGAFTLARLLEEDIELSGYQVKSGTMVLCHHMIASRKEENFTKADQYIPDRWIPESSFWTSSATPPNHTPALVSPFGNGRRQCPGRRFSSLELLVVVRKVREIRNDPLIINTKFNLV